MKPSIETERLVIRPWRDTDVSDALMIYGDDLEIGWQLARKAWGHGYAAEAGEALARWSIHRAGVEEVFALVGADNTRAAATAQRIGMEWIGETDQYHQQHLSLYRLRHSDLAYHQESSEDEVTERPGVVL